MFNSKKNKTKKNERIQDINLVLIFKKSSMFINDFFNKLNILKTPFVDFNVVYFITR